jgi:hypothetical protein
MLGLTSETPRAGNMRTTVTSTTKGTALRTGASQAAPSDPSKKISDLFAAGIDWRPVLAQVAAIANPGTGGGGTCMRQHLEGFPRSGYFLKSVSPELREAGRKALADSIRA